MGGKGGDGNEPVVTHYLHTGETQTQKNQVIAILNTPTVVPQGRLPHQITSHIWPFGNACVCGVVFGTHSDTAQVERQYWECVKIRDNFQTQ